MTLITRIANHFDTIYGALRSIRTTKKRTETRLLAVEEEIKRLKSTNDLPLDAGLSNIHHMVPLIIHTRVVPGIYGETSCADEKMVYYRARRIEIDPQFDVTGHRRWRVDPDDDTADYIVVPTPGNTGMFVGCRLWAMLSHEISIDSEVEENSYTGQVYVPVTGEHHGFMAILNGIDEEDSGEYGKYLYHWRQCGTGLFNDDVYYSGRVLTEVDLGLDSEIEVTLPRALNIAALAFDPDITEHRAYEAGVPVFLRWADVDYGYAEPIGFHFNGGLYPATEAECG